jgi:hypothetical protein
MTLSFVLHGPDLAANLLSIAHITLELNYFSNFLLLLLLLSRPSHGKDDWQWYLEGWLVLFGLSAQHTRSAHICLSYGSSGLLYS